MHGDEPIEWCQTGDETVRCGSVECVEASRERAEIEAIVADGQARLMEVEQAMTEFPPEFVDARDAMNDQLGQLRELVPGCVALEHDSLGD